jgi:ferredoxin
MGRMSRLRVDRDLCEGYANCVFQAPDVFDLGDDNIVVIQAEDISEAERERVAEAVVSCPVAALVLDDD